MSVSLQIRICLSRSFLPRRHCLQTTISYPLRPSFTRLTTSPSSQSNATKEDNKKTFSQSKAEENGKKKDTEAMKDDDFEIWLLLAVTAAVKSSRILRSVKKYFNSWMNAKSKVEEAECDKILEERIKTLTEQVDTSVNGTGKSTED